MGSWMLPKNGIGMKCSEAELMAAMLHQAVIDIRLCIANRAARHTRYAWDAYSAIEWIGSNDESPFSFLNACWWCKIDPAYFRDRIRRRFKNRIWKLLNYKIRFPSTSTDPDLPWKGRRVPPPANREEDNDLNLAYQLGSVLYMAGYRQKVNGYTRYVRK